MGRQAESIRSQGFGIQALLVTVLFLAAVAGIAWVYMGMITRDRWPVRWLDVDGAFEHVNAEQVRNRLQPLVTGSFFTVDLPAIRNSVGQMAWVSQVVVHKTWPDTVSVSVYEYVPMAHWTNGALMDTSGSVFKVPGAGGMQGLPWLEGPAGTEADVFTTWQEFNNQLAPAGLEIHRIKLDLRGAWNLELTNGTAVQLGREDAIERLHRMVTSWHQLTEGQQRLPAGVDLRYTNGFAVRWPEPAEPMGANPG